MSRGGRCWRTRPTVLANPEATPMIPVFTFGMLRSDSVLWHLLRRVFSTLISTMTHPEKIYSVWSLGT